MNSPISTAALEIIVGQDQSPGGEGSNFRVKLRKFRVKLRKIPKGQGFAGRDLCCLKW